MSPLQEGLHEQHRVHEASKSARGNRQSQCSRSGKEYFHFDFTSLLFHLPKIRCSIFLIDEVSLLFQADLCQCKYCYKEFDTPYAMQSHLEEVHLKKGSEFVCRFRLFLSFSIVSYNQNYPASDFLVLQFCQLWMKT